MQTARPVGEFLREWRQRRRLSQLDFACEAGISARHLSFLETGRATPSRGMLLRLAEQLTVPLRERNAMLVAAGFAPVFSERSLDDPALGAARKAMDLLLRAHEPYPALAVDRHWNMVAANRSIGPFLQDVSAALLQPPVNVLRLGLHPEGLAPRIVNLGQVRRHLLERLRRQVEVCADPQLSELLQELTAYPGAPELAGAAQEHEYPGVLVPMILRSGDALLSFISTTTVFGSPIDITLSELALETFFPSDDATAAVLRRMAAEANATGAAPDAAG